MSLDFSELQRLSLDGFLQVNVSFVGTVQGHFQFGDLDLQLLLDACNFGLKASFSLDDAGTELFNFNAGSFAANKINF